MQVLVASNRLVWVAKKRSKAMVKLLLGADRVDVNVKDVNG